MTGGIRPVVMRLGGKVTCCIWLGDVSAWEAWLEAWLEVFGLLTRMVGTHIIVLHFAFEWEARRVAFGLVTRLRGKHD